MNDTINYYNNNAKSFYEKTLNVDLSENYKKFSKYLLEDAHILDAGCGSGRDSQFFKNQGYEVTAFDASIKMVRMASITADIEILNLNFYDMKFKQEFDAVWAQASLLHVSYKQTREIYEKIYDALKPNGIFYASYKYGDGHVKINERDFWYMNEIIVFPYLQSLFKIIDIWKETDDRNRLSSGLDNTWLSFIAKKI